MSRDMADAHEAARTRDAAWMLAALNGTGEPRTRTHAINPDTGEFTRLYQESDMTDHRAEADVLMSTAWMETGDRVQTHALLAIHDTLKDIAGNSAEQHATLTEIRDRLPEREVACGDVWRDETERPCTRPSGHDGNHVDKVGTIWANPGPAPADVDPDEGLAMDLYHASLLIPPVKEIGPTAWLSKRDHEMWLGVARAAREHIAQEAKRWMAGGEP